MKKKSPLFLTNIVVKKLWYGGIGVASSHDGKKILIRWWVLPWSTVSCRVIKKKKDYYDAVVTHIHDIGSQVQIQEQRCPHYLRSQDAYKDFPLHKKWCGWCKWQILSYSYECELKKNLVEDSFRSIKEIFDNAWSGEVIPSPLEWWYRNKIEFSFGNYISEQEDYHQEWNIWFHKQWQFSKIIDIDQCFLIPQSMHEVFAYLKKKCQQSWLAVHDQIKHRGIFRHMVIREGYHTGHILVNLAIANSTMSDQEQYDFQQFCDHLQQDERLRQHVTSFVLTINNGLADIVRPHDAEILLLRWEGHIFEQLHFQLPSEKSTLIEDSDDLKKNIVLNFQISPFSFFQTNTLAAQQLFSIASEMLWSVQWSLIDLYCGAWAIGQIFYALGKWDRVVWVEIVEEAIVDAQKNALLNRMEQKTLYFAWRAEHYLCDSQFLQQLGDIGAIIVDPPRDGLHKTVIDVIAHLKRDYSFKILYISCNPVTMARDIWLFAERGIIVRQLKAVDMFPHTHHIECIGVLR